MEKEAETERKLAVIRKHLFCFNSWELKGGKTVCCGMGLALYGRWMKCYCFTPLYYVLFSEAEKHSQVAKIQYGQKIMEKESQRQISEIEGIIYFYAHLEEFDVIPVQCTNNHYTRSTNGTKSKREEFKQT